MMAKTFPAEHFGRQEFACRDGCGFDTVDAELLEVLQQARWDLGHAIIIHDGARCKRHNKDVGGEDDSFHLFGKAADIHMKGISHRRLYNYFNDEYPDRFGLILYSWGVHIDVRRNKYRDTRP